MSKIIIVGLGYVGLPLAVRAAEAGHQVIGLDTDTVKLEMIRAFVSPVEDVSNDRLEKAVASGNLVPMLSWDPQEKAPGLSFEFGIIAVPTPLRDGLPDLSYVESAARVLGQVLGLGGTVVLESTTYPGTTEGLLKDVLEEESGLLAGYDFHLGFSPERIDPGSSDFTLENTPKLVSATTARGLREITGFYDSIVETTVPVSSPRVAEMTKLYENIQATVNIALINEMAGICHDLKIDVHEVVEASMTKGHSMARWTPGPGVGGHCLAIDHMYLSWLTSTQLGRSFQFAILAEEINKGRPTYVVDRAEALLTDRGVSLDRTPVLVLGTAYKPNVGDLRESPAIDIVTELMARGAKVTVCDPHVNGWALTPALPLAALPSSLSEFPLAVLVTDHSAFDYHTIARLAPLVLDCRNAMSPSATVIAL